MLNELETKKILRAIRINPAKEIELIFNCWLWEVQKEIIKSVLVEKNKKTAVRSCHDSGKSFTGAKIALIYLFANPDALVLTTAPSWTQVREILWREIRGSYTRFKLFIESKEIVFEAKMLETKLEFGENWFAIGLATRKTGEASEVAERMLGFHAITGKILVIVDEGPGVEEPIWGAIDGLLTSADAQLLALGNPYRSTGSFANLFKEKGVYKIHIQDTDIPNIKENRIIIPGLMSPSYPLEMEKKYGKDSNLYLIKVKGEFPKTDQDVLISLSDVEEAFLRFEEVEAVGEKTLGIDVARFGDDRTVFLVRQGYKILRKETYGKEDTMQTVGRAVRIIDEEKILPENVFIDVIGIGAGVVDRLKEKEYNINGINVGMSAAQPEQFFNIRAEAYWKIRDWIKKAGLPKDDDLLELANIKYKYSSERKGQLKIEPKEDIKKRGLVSPDVADALMLTFCQKSEDEYGHFEVW